MLGERRAFKALNLKLKLTVFGLLHENDLNVLVNQNKHKCSKKKLDDETQPFNIGWLSTPTGMANCSLVEYTDKSSDDEQLTPGIAVAMDISIPPNHKIALPICMPIATAVSSNVMLNISATTVTSRNLSNSKSLVWLSAAVSSKGAMKLLQLTHQPMSTNLRLQYHQQPIKNCWSAAATSSEDAIASIIVDADAETPHTVLKKVGHCTG